MDSRQPASDFERAPVGRADILADQDDSRILPQPFPKRPVEGRELSARLGGRGAPFAPAAGSLWSACASLARSGRGASSARSISTATRSRTRATLAAISADARHEPTACSPGRAPRRSLSRSYRGRHRSWSVPGGTYRRGRKPAHPARAHSARRKQALQTGPPGATYR